MRKSIAGLLAAALAVVAFSAQLMAQIIPPNLAAGSQYQLIFQTADVTAATNRSISYYNSFVTSEAALNPFLPQGVTWHAVGSTVELPSGAFIKASDNAPSVPGIPVYNTEGQLVAPGAQGLYSGLPLTNPVGFDQFGNTHPFFDFAWTGATTVGGDPGGFYVLGSPTPIMGDPHTTAVGWISDGPGEPPYDPYSVYALSTPITATPEPGSLSLAALGLVGLLAWGWRRRKR